MCARIDRFPEPYCAASTSKNVGKTVMGKLDVNIQFPKFHGQ